MPCTLGNAIVVVYSRWWHGILSQDDGRSRETPQDVVQRCVRGSTYYWHVRAGPSCIIVRCTRTVQCMSGPYVENVSSPLLLLAMLAGGICCAVHACMHALMHVRTRTLARCCTDGLQSSYCPSVVDHQSMQQQGKHHRCIILALHRRHTGPTYRRRKAACTLHSQVSRRQQQGRGSDRARTSACHIRKRAEDADRVRQARPSGSFHSK